MLTRKYPRQCGVHLTTFIYLLHRLNRTLNLSFNLFNTFRWVQVIDFYTKLLKCIFALRNCHRLWNFEVIHFTIDGIKMSIVYLQPTLPIELLLVRRWKRIRQFFFRRLLASRCPNLNSTSSASLCIRWVKHDSWIKFKV